MDALASAQQGTQQALKQWASDGQTLIKSATAMGIDTAQYTGALTGSTARPASSTRTRSRTTSSRRSASRASNGGGGNGRSSSSVTGEQILSYLRETGGATVDQLATQFGVAGQTIRRRGKELGSQLEHDGAVWKASGAVAAAA